MANTLNLGNGNWATKEDSLLAYNSENGNFKPLPFDFTRASSATVVNKAGLIETVGGGEPRIDFSNDAKGALLLEPSRSNLIPYSEDFENSDWVKSSTGINTSIGTNGINPNIAISPQGTLNADRVNFNLQSDLDSGMFDVFGASANNSYSTSVFLKGEGSNVGKKISIRVKRLSGGTFTSVDTHYTLTDKWVRFELDPLTLPIGASNGIISFTSSEATSCLIFGAQVEQGSYATSYIPTQGSAVTRVADSSSQTVPSGIIGQTEGTLFIEYPNIDNTFAFIGLTEGNNSNRMIVYSSGDNILKAQFRQLGTIKLSSSSSVITGKVKCALSFSSTESVFYVNGTQIAVGTSSAWSSLNEITLNQANQIGAKVSEIKYYNTRLSNAELQALTK